MSKNVKKGIEPHLRFPEFQKSGAWAVSTIDNIATKIGSGITPKGGSENYKKTGRPFVRSQNVGWGTLILDDIAFIDEKTHSTFSSTEIMMDDVLLNITGASIGRSAIADKRVVGGNVNQHVCIIRLKDGKLPPAYLCQYLLSPFGQNQIDSFQAGGNREGLNFGQIRSIKLPISTEPKEQRKIADCLSSLDEVITAQGEKVEALKTYKKGLLQQLFPQEGQTTPTLRFPEFKKSGDWETLPLSEISDRIVEKVGDQKLTTVSITAGTGFVSQAEKFSRDISGKQYHNYIVLRAGEFSYNKGNSKRFPQGCIYKLVEFEKVAAPNAFISFKLKRGFIPDFYQPYFDNNHHGRQLQKFITSGARSDGLLNISADDFFSITFPTPRDIEEQKKIAEFMISCNKIISAEIDILECLKAHKKGLLQQLFPIVESKGE